MLYCVVCHLLVGWIRRKNVFLDDRVCETIHGCLPVISGINWHVNFLKANLSLISTFNSFILWYMVSFLYILVLYSLLVWCIFESLKLFGLELTKHRILNIWMNEVLIYAVIISKFKKNEDKKIMILTKDTYKWKNFEI